MKKYVSALFALLFCFLAVPVNGIADETEASPHFTWDAKGLAGDANLLFDSDRGTRIAVDGETVISISSAVPVSQVYLVWDKPPSVWDVVSTGAYGERERQTFGRHGFLHEYAGLSGPLNRFDLVFHGSESILCDIHLFGEGEAPAWVQKWQPPCDRADLLLFSPRAGNEFLNYGGAIPYYANLGLDVQLAYMTQLDSYPAYNHATLDALYSSGLRNYPVFSGIPEFLDSDADVYELYDEGELLAFEVEQLRRFRPTVVIGPAENDCELDGLCYETLTVAVSLASQKLEYPDSTKSYGEYSAPKLYLHGHPENEIVMDWNALTLGFDGKTSMDAAKNAIKAYTWRADTAHSGSGDADCRKFGLYQSTVGQDIIRNDFFENTQIGRTVPANLPAHAEPAVMSGAEPESAAESAPPPHPQIGLQPPIPLSLLAIIAFICLLAAILLIIKKEN